MLTLVVSSVAACSVSTPSAKVPINLPELPAELLPCVKGDKTCKPPCPNPVVVPDRDIDQTEVEKYWRKDRTRLVMCRKTNSALIGYYEALRANLAATGE
jgi:hypothetical protein